jgi:hypothetical protein
MKIREVLKLTKPYLPGGARSVAADRTQTMVAQVQAPNRIARRRERLPAQDSFAAADANDGMTGDVPPVLDLSPTSLAPISTPNRRDLDFIKAQLAKLPRHTEQ